MQPIPASTVLLVRNGDGVEVIMGLRPAGGPFGGVWVFPGGAVEETDRRVAGDPDLAFRLAGLRETAEEIGVTITRPADIVLDPGGDLYVQLRAAAAAFDTDRLIYLSNWVTPRMVSKRFDTRFYLIPVDPNTEPMAVSEEFREVRWVSARSALEQSGRDEMPMIAPTIAHLDYLARFEDVETLVQAVKDTDRIPQIEPRMFERGGKTVIEVTGDARFRL